MKASEFNKFFLFFVAVAFAVLCWFLFLKPADERFESTVLFGCCNPDGLCTTCDDKNSLDLYKKGDGATLAAIRLVYNSEKTCEFEQKLTNQNAGLFFDYLHHGKSCQLKVSTTKEHATIYFGSTDCLKHFCDVVDETKYDLDRVAP